MPTIVPVIIPYYEDNSMIELAKCKLADTKTEQLQCINQVQTDKQNADTGMAIIMLILIAATIVICWWMTKD
jgi:hypothetical protein